ncbi:MAG: LptE family protein [Verrucomicrobia bacterium]|nr:LptE family protein [Verrucomicrobiota bacterium]
MSTDRPARIAVKRALWWPAGLVLFCAVATMMTGCVGYRLGTTLPPGITSVYVPTAINDTPEPQLETEVTRAVIQEFQRDGTLKVAAAGEADSQLEIKIVEFKLEPLRYERDRAKTTREYRMRIFADIIFTRPGTGEVLLARRTQGNTTFEFFGDLGTSKIQALPAASRDLAHQIVETMVEYW